MSSTDDVKTTTPSTDSVDKSVPSEKPQVPQTPETPQTPDLSDTKPTPLPTQNQMPSATTIPESQTPKPEATEPTSIEEKVQQLIKALSDDYPILKQLQTKPKK